MSTQTKNLITGIAGLAIVTGAIWTNQKSIIEESELLQNGAEPAREQIATFRDEGLGISFEYRLVPDGYTLFEEEYEEESVLVHNVLIQNTQAYTEFLSYDSPTEGPPSISIRIFENPENLSPKEWAENKIRWSNYNLAISPMKETVIGDVPGVIYERDGLYMGTVIVAGNNFKIYVIDGDYSSPTDEIKADFEKLIESIEFFQ